MNTPIYMHAGSNPLAKFADDRHGSFWLLRSAWLDLRAYGLISAISALIRDLRQGVQHNAA